MKTSYVLSVLRFLCLITLVIFQSCEKDPDPVVPVGADGFFVVNEGGFGNGNSSLSFYDRKTDQLTNNVFAAKNGRPLGDQAQSMTVFEGKGYIVVQNSAKIEVIDATDFSSIKTITEEIESPRYFIGITPTKGYVSDWGADGISGTVKVINLENFTVTKTIQIGQGTNRFIKKDNLVYVANSGGFGKDNTIKVINTTTDAVIKTITVGDNPSALQLDRDGNIWVASGGNLVYNSDWSINETESTKSSLSKIAADAESLRLTFVGLTYNGLGQLGISPEGDQLYYNYDGAVYSIKTSATTLPTVPFLDKSYYSLTVDPFNGNIIGGMAPNFSSAGTIDVYSAAGSLLKSQTVGIAPNGCAFK
jgi:YVTN family beta-propeller protein